MTSASGSGVHDGRWGIKQMAFLIPNHLMYIFRLIIGPVIIRGKCGMAYLSVEGDSLGMMNYGDNKHASHETGYVIRNLFYIKYPIYPFCAPIRTA